MTLDRYAFGMHVGKGLVLDNIEPIPFTDEELAELIGIDPRLICFQHNKYNCVRLERERLELYYFSLGDYCYLASLRDGIYDKANDVYSPFAPVLFILDQFDALKEKVLEYSLIDF